MTYQTYHHTRNYGCRITEFILAGHRAVALENEKLRVTLLADKGTDIYEFLYKPCDVDFMWRTWAGLRDRSHYWPSSPRPAGPHNDFYEGGWQELFPNCGAPSEHQGAEIGQHGEVLLLPWRYVVTKDDVEEIEVRFEVRTVRTPFHLVKTVSLRRNEAVLRIHERVTNEGGQQVDFTWGHHPAFGWPFIDESCRVDVPACRIRTIEDYTPPASRLKPKQLGDWPMAEAAAGGQIDLSRIPGPDAGVYAATKFAVRALTEGLRQELRARKSPIRVTAISPEVVNGQVTGTVAFTGAVPEGLKQSQRVTTRLVFESKKDVLKVARGAFVESGGGRVAYVVSGSSEKRPETA